MEMTPAQVRALKLYCSSATIQNGYAPMTFEEIAKELRSEGLQGSSSSIQRWSVKFDFRAHLEAQIQLAVIDGGDAKSIALRKIDSTKAVDIIRNNELTANGYEILEIYVNEVLEHHDRTGKISIKDVKVVKDIVVLTSGREDKLLDRLAGIGGEKLSSSDLKKEFDMIDMDMEE